MLRPLNVASALRLVFGLLALTMATPEAAALSQRTFVASYGSDASPNCALLAPCRSFNAAIAQTSGGGEVVILDTAGYGPMVINKALKVIGPSGVYGGISVIGGAGPTTGIVINAANGDDITLRGLDISGVPGAAGPFPDIGIDIQNAGGVHIEKSTVSNFTQDTSACIKVTAASTVRVYVDDSFLRACRTGIYANGTAPLANRPSVLVDNTRIERGRGTVSYGVWMQGAIDVSLRNSMISRQDAGIQFDNVLSGQVSHLELIGSEMARNTTAILVNNTTNGSPQISIVGSQIVQADNLMLVSNNAIGGNVWVQVADSFLSYTGVNGLTFSNSAADVNTRMALEMVRSQVGNITGISLILNATNGCQIQADIRDSTLFGAGTILKTLGTSSFINVSLIRSNLNHATTAIDHGQGSIQLDSTHVNYNLNDFVNTGSGTIVSNGQNMVYNNINAPGPVFITPLVIPLK